MSRRMSLTKNSLPIRKIHYYIPKLVLERYNQIVKSLGKEYEEKNFKSNVMYKLSGSAYVNKKLEIHVKSGIPGKITFNSEKLGECLVNSSEKNLEVLSRKYDIQIDDIGEIKDYIVKPSLITERTWEIFDMDGILLKDLTDYDNWKGK